MDTLRTPDAWGTLLGYQVMDADGWRSDNKPWETPVTEAEYLDRVGVCTLRRVEPLLGYVTVKFEVRSGTDIGGLEDAPEDYVVLRAGTVISHNVSPATARRLVEITNVGDLDPDGSLQSAVHDIVGPWETA